MEENIRQRYIKIKRIGEGTYGKVFQAKSVANDKIVALKKVKNDNEDMNDEGIPSTALREIACLKALNHPNIVKYLLDLSIFGYLLLLYNYLDSWMLIICSPKTNSTSSLSSQSRISKLIRENWVEKYLFPQSRYILPPLSFVVLTYLLCKVLHDADIIGNGTLSL